MKAKYQSGTSFCIEISDSTRRTCMTVADAVRFKEELTKAIDDAAIDKKKELTGRIMSKAEKAALKALPDYSPDGKTKVDLTLDRLLYQHAYEQAEKDTIERACKWLFSHFPILIDYYDEDIYKKADRSEFIKLFRTQMDEEQ